LKRVFLTALSNFYAESGDILGPLRDLVSVPVTTLEHPGMGAPIWHPETEAERQAIRDQLERILASRLFRNSKRYPSLLRFVVEHTLKGDLGDLKERTLGVQVFGRDPHYDTNADPVVRITAVEVRKRIAQYYRELGVPSELRIDFPAGSYLPEFRLPAQIPVEKPAQTIISAPAQPTRKFRPLLVVGLAALGCCVAVLTALSIRHSPPSAFDLFWQPVLNSQNSILLCISRAGIRPPDSAALPNPAAPSAPATSLLSVADAQRADKVAYSDALALSLFTSFFGSKHHAFHVRRSSAIGLSELRDGPVVSIGGFNNAWNKRITDDLRFSFVYDGKRACLQDARNPSSKKWAIDMHEASSNLAEDYALITRVADPMIGRVVVTAGGISRFGTMAVGEFLTQPQYMAEAMKLAPGDWEHKNIQIVVATKIAGEDAGPPQVIAASLF
jgi:hypothetical protein